MPKGPTKKKRISFFFPHNRRIRSWWLTGESRWTPAGKSADWMDRPEEQSRAADEVGSVAEFQHRKALFEIETRLSDT